MLYSTKAWFMLLGTAVGSVVIPTIGLHVELPGPWLGWLVILLTLVATIVVPSFAIRFFSKEYKGFGYWCSVFVAVFTILFSLMTSYAGLTQITSVESSPIGTVTGPMEWPTPLP